ncbi:hypothetical protein TNCT_185221 [Trichonephila clavata]|uniref:Uncharacterized protein n=1 Tax=Trichonephila clavata TaxID=2740835 RepID=A0A8X6GBH0_TRICU|nr:hypothetical protein TNCT_185221 [Trichonephila clavata]
MEYTYSNLKTVRTTPLFRSINQCIKHFIANNLPVNNCLDSFSSTIGFKSNKCVDLARNENQNETISESLGSNDSVHYRREKECLFFVSFPKIEEERGLFGRRSVRCHLVFGSISLRDSPAETPSDSK